MKKANFAIIAAVFGIVTGTLLITTGAMNLASERAVEENPILDTMKTKIFLLKDAIDLHKDLVKTDTIEYASYRHYELSYFPEKHSDSLRVTWPDGSQTLGLEKRQDVLKSIFAHAPDTRIMVHPSQYGIEDKTGLSGTITGTFTEPMKIGGGKQVAPTGRTFSIPLYAMAVWENEVIVEEYLYWDDEYHKAQLGLRHESWKIIDQVKNIIQPSKNEGTNS